MRSPSLGFALLSSLLMAGCTSVGLDTMMAGTSAETTNSIVRPRVPSSPVLSAAQPGASAPAVAEAPTLPSADPAPVIAAEEGSDSALPTVRPVALTAPANPVPKPFEPPASEARTRPMAPDLLHRRRFRDAKPINFGSSSPRQLAVHGVDVSRWQGNIDWPKLRSQGANFAYIKATDGGDHLDPMFKKNWRAAHAAGLRRGAYHFFYWCRTGGEQADWFIRNVPKVEGALPPVIDVEWNGESRCKRRLSPAQVREKMQVFMDKLERHYGQRPIIYTAPDFYADNLQGAFLDYPFWLRAVARHPSKVYPGRKWVFWQYSGSGLSHGVSGKIDLNVFYGSERQWHDWVARNGH